MKYKLTDKAHRPFRLSGAAAACCAAMVLAAPVNAGCGAPPSAGYSAQSSFVWPASAYAMSKPPKAKPPAQKSFVLKPPPAKPSPPAPRASKPPSAAPKQKTDPKTAADMSAERRMLELVNAERAKAELTPLALSGDLTMVARLKSQDMRDNAYLSHTSPTFGSPFDMMKRFGIAYKTAGENIAKGQKTPEEAMGFFMKSEGHRRNILNPAFAQMGVGFVQCGSGAASGMICTQLFIG